MNAKEPLQIGRIIIIIWQLPISINHNQSIEDNLSIKKKERKS
mgnify:CR=1 FL=1